MAKASFRFLVVKFTSERPVKVDVVPETWVDGQLCYWPTGKSHSKITKLVKKFSEPVPEWEKTEYQIITSSSSYEKAVRKADRACEKSDVSDSAGDEGRRLCRALQPRPISYNLDLQPPIITTPSRPSELHLSTPSALRATTINTTPISATPSESITCILRRIFTEIEKLRRSQDLMQMEQEKIRHLVAGSSAVKECTVPANCPQLPADTPDQLAEIEAYLSIKDNFSHLCSYFGGRGGVNAACAVRSILASLLSNKLSLMYNWKGTNGVKLAFSKFPNICRLITASVRQHHSFERTTEKEIEAAIKKWLVYSKDRNGGRARRAQGRREIESTEIEAVGIESVN